MRAEGLRRRIIRQRKQNTVKALRANSASCRNCGAEAPDEGQ